MTLVAEPLGERTEIAGPPAKLAHAFSLTGSYAAKWVLRLAAVVVLARSLGPQRFGVYALLFALTEFLAAASGTGYMDYLTREAAKDARLGWGLASQLTLLRMAVAIPLAVLEVAALRLMHYPRLVLAYTAFMALTLIPRSMSEAVQGVLRGIHQYNGYLEIELVFGAGLVGGSALLWFRHGGVGYAVAAEIIAAVAAALAGLALGVKFMTAERFGLSAAHLLKKGAVFNAYSFIGSLYDRFDVVLLSKLAGDYATGINSAAYRALNLTQIAAYGVLYSLLPGLSRGAGSREEQCRLEKAMRALLGAAFVIVLFVLVFARPAVRLILGPAYLEAASALQVLIWAVIPRYLNCALNMALLAAGREKVFVSTALTCLSLNLLGNLTLVPMYGWRAAAALTIVTELVLLAQNLYWTRRIANPANLSRGMAHSALAFLVFLLAIWGAGYWGWQLAVGSASVAAYACYLYSSGTLAEFRTVWGTE